MKPTRAKLAFVFLVVHLVLLALPASAKEARPTGTTYQTSPGIMTAKQARQKSATGEILLLDIRMPKEWKETGIAEGAHPVTMHQSATGFLKELNELASHDKGKPIALICATGGRSAFIRRYLTKAGYSNVMDVGEGMLGSKHGPGWLKLNLPIKKYQPPKRN